MKKIDAHAHIGYIGGWADVGITGEELVAQMDRFEIEKTVLCCEDNDAVLNMMHKYPNRLFGAVYVNPLNPESVNTMKSRILSGFIAVKLNPLRHAYCADAKLVYPVMDIARKHGVPVCIHSGHPPYSLPWQIGLLAENFPDVKDVYKRQSLSLCASLCSYASARAVGSRLNGHAAWHLPQLIQAVSSGI